MHEKNDWTLKEAINELLKQYQIRGKLKEVNIVEHWEKIMGKVIAKHTLKVYISKKKLYVALDSAALKQELSYSKHKIIEVLNREADENIIEEVIFM